jgi:hypothetical protein
LLPVSDLVKMSGDMHFFVSDNTDGIFIQAFFEICVYEL